jgi:hypothetical protein
VARNLTILQESERVSVTLKRQRLFLINVYILRFNGETAAVIKMVDTNNVNIVRFQVLMAASMKMAVFWVLHRVVW